METLNIEKEKAINAYQHGSEEQKKVLEQLFGKETFRQLMVTDRIKTFNDALIELGPNHPLVKEFEAIHKADNTPNLINYSKLCIVTAALNEGWTPKLIEGEKRYSPCFFLYTDKEIRNMSKEEKSHVIYQSCDYASGGVSLAFTNCDTTTVRFGSRLAFKTSELAEYAGKQFCKLYANYLGI